jgi:molybdopterin-guanine dinucleotide biosynthesis protein A
LPMCSAPREPEPAAHGGPMLGGIFVGGQSARMGSTPKGLLPAPSGETLVERWATLFDALGIPVVLVGRHEAYRSFAFEQIEDAEPGIGPLGGLISLLERAERGLAIAVACDMPYVSPLLVEKLAYHPSVAIALAPKEAGKWQPLFARFQVARALGPARRRAALGHLSLQGLLDELGAETLVLDQAELRELRDWDTPEDFARR